MGIFSFRRETPRESCGFREVAPICHNVRMSILPERLPSGRQSCRCHQEMEQPPPALCFRASRAPLRSRPHALTAASSPTSPHAPAAVAPASGGTGSEAPEGNAL